MFLGLCRRDLSQTVTETPDKDGVMLAEAGERKSGKRTTYGRGVREGEEQRKISWDKVSWDTTSLNFCALSSFQL